MSAVTCLIGCCFEQNYDTGVTYLISFECARTLRWEAVAGPDAGQSRLVPYDSVQIAPNLYFITWPEEDGTVISQVIDYDQLVVYTSLACDGNLIMLTGTVTRVNR